MDFTEVKCRSCGAAMRVPDGATRVRCNYCGTEYALSAKRQAPEYNPVKTIRYKGREEYLYTYLPQNWTLRVIEDSQMCIRDRCADAVLSLCLFSRFYAGWIWN